MLKRFFVTIGCGAILAMSGLPPGTTSGASVPGALTLSGASPFGTFAGISYIRYRGRFAGTTTLGAFDVPFEIVAPEAPVLGNGTVLVEPPHFAFGPAGRDFVFGRELLFSRGFSYAAVGFGSNRMNALDPDASNIVLAGVMLPSPVPFDPFGVVDEEIISQFVGALTADPVAVAALGPISRRYAYGISQSAAAVLETLLSPAGRGLFELTILHIALWRPFFQPPGVFDRQAGEFAPPTAVGRVVFVAAEGDQIVSDSEQFRRTINDPAYRLYEVAGAAHQPSAANPLDHFPIVRALLVRGDSWVRLGSPPPPSHLLEVAPPGQVDPVYGAVTGIARDQDLNAIGGVRLPGIATSRARFIASDSTVAPLPGLNGLLGDTVDLSCEPPADAIGDEPRFRNHGDYLNQFVRAVNGLRAAGFLLEADADALKQSAESSEIGKPGLCA